MEFIFLLLSFLYVIFNFILFIAFIKNDFEQNFAKQSFTKGKFAGNEITFSVVISAKNEEKNIPGLLKSLQNLEYPKNQFEIIIVDDNSNDNTLNILNKYLSQISNLRVITANHKTYPGKKGTLSIGISKAKNGYVIITDADCTPRPAWLKAFSKKFSEGMDLVFGIVSYKKTNSFVGKLSMYENLRSRFLIFSAAKLGFPYSASGASFAFRKDVYNNLGGYENTIQTLSGDDDLFLREAVKKGYKIGTIVNRDSFVLTSPPETLNKYLEQKARHTSTSNYYLLQHKLFLSLWHIINLTALFSPILFFVSIYALVPFATKLFIDIITIKNIQKYFEYKFSLTEIIFYQILYEFFLIIHYFNGTFRKIKWK